MPPMSTPGDAAHGRGRRREAGRRPAGARRNAAATRAGIFTHARMQFCARGYDHVGLRDIARAAGVDAALVVRYFGSKDALFAEVVAAVVDPSALFAGDRATLGRRLARHLVTPAGGAGGDASPITLMLRSASSPRGAALLRAGLEQRFIRPLAGWLGGRDAMVRAAVVTSHLMGAAVMRALFAPTALTRARADGLVRWLAPALQAAIDGRTGPSTPTPRLRAGSAPPRRRGAAGAGGRRRS